MGIQVKISVIPRSGKQSIKQEKNGQLKFYLKSPPENGKANKELIRFLSKLLKTPQINISIIQGHTSRKKILFFHTIPTFELLLEKLKLENQYSLLDQCQQGK